MKRISLLAFAPLLLTASCGKSAPAEEPVREPETGPEAAAESADVAEPAAEQAPEPEEKKYRGKAVRTVDGGPAGEGEVVLTVADDQSIAGSLSLDGTDHSVSCKVDAERLRCWVRGGAGDTDSVRRGYLEGKVVDGGYEGTFAISGHGGVEPTSGTWTASLD
jgi:hypothetical protein